MLEVNELHSGYGKVPVLKNISFSVQPGEILLVVGENGAGKSTLLNTIGGFIKPERGTIKLDGKEIGGKQPEDIARSGLAHFRNQMARYASQWPYLVPEWSSWIAYFECLERYGYEAAKIIKPADEESEPSQLCAALTKRLVGLFNVSDNRIATAEIGRREVLPGDSG